MKKKGFGLMRLPATDPQNPAVIGLEQVRATADLFPEKRFTCLKAVSGHFDR